MDGKSLYKGQWWQIKSHFARKTGALVYIPFRSTVGFPQWITFQDLWWDFMSCTSIFRGNMLRWRPKVENKKKHQISSPHNTQQKYHAIPQGPNTCAPKVGYKNDWSIHCFRYFCFLPSLWNPLNTSLVLFNYSLNSHFLLSPKAIHTILARGNSPQISLPVFWGGVDLQRRSQVPN